MARPRTVTDDEILDATARVVARLGPLRFTLADVGAEVGLTASALLRRFETKRALLLAMSERSRAGVSAAFAPRAGEWPTETLLRALASQTRGLATPREVANGLAFLAIDMTDPDFRRVALGFFDAFRHEVRALLEAAVEAKELRAHDAAAMARAVVVAFNGSVVTWGVHQDGAVEDALRRDVEVLLAPLRRTRTGRGAQSPPALRPRGAGRASRGR